jgi:hypothetical protein
MHGDLMNQQRRTCVLDLIASFARSLQTILMVVRLLRLFAIA